LLKNKYGRIYFDYEAEWFEPILKCLNDGTASFNLPASSLPVAALKKLLGNFETDSVVQLERKENEWNFPRLVRSHVF
jgi:hypothetical protein